MKTPSKKTTASSKSADSKTATKAAASKKSTAGANGSARGDLEKIMKDMMKDIYWAEKHLQKALGKLSKNASHQELADAYLKHQEQTGTHIQRLEQAFELMGANAQAKKCPAMEGLIEEANEEIE